MTGRTPSDGKVRLELSSVWEEVSDKKSLTFLGFRQVLYIEVLEAVTCPNNFPKICGIQGARS